MEKAWEELALAVGALKDSEFHLLQAWAAMRSLKVNPVVPKTIEEWAKTIQEATTISQGFLDVLGDELGYDDPFSPSSSSEE